jgi:hypothetical protein
MRVQGEARGNARRWHACRLRPRRHGTSEIDVDDDTAEVEEQRIDGRTTRLAGPFPIREQSAYR